MAFADSVGALATMLNLPPGAGTTTIESAEERTEEEREAAVRAAASEGIDVREPDTAEEEAEAERKRLQAIAQAESDRLLEEARKAQEAAKTQEDPFLAALAQSEAEEKAEEFKQSVYDHHAIQVPVAPTQKVTGSASKTYEVWDYEITDGALVPLQFRPIDEKLIAAEVRRLKGETDIPGVKVSSRIEVK